MRLRFILALIGFIAAGCSGAAQRPDSQSANSTQPNYQIVARNEFRDGTEMTVVALNPIEIAMQDHSGATGDMTSMFAYETAKRVVSAVTISFHSESPKCRFPQQAEATFFLDGEQFRIRENNEAASKEQGAAYSFSEPYSGGCKESLTMIVPVARFRQISSAQKVIVQFGDLKFDLRQSHLMALRDLAVRIGTVGN